MEKRRDLAFPLIPQKHNILAATRRTCNSIRPQPRSIQASKNKSLTNICDHNILSLFALGRAGCQKHSRTVLLQIERDYRSGGSVRKIVAGKEIENRSATKIPSILFSRACKDCSGFAGKPAFLRGSGYRRKQRGPVRKCASCAEQKSLPRRPSPRMARVSAEVRN